MSVIRHDFGAEQRRTEKRFRNLLDLDALHEANIKANPLPYLERASERIFQLEKTIFEAAVAGRPPSGADAGVTVTVDAAQYQRLKQCQALLEAALKEIEARDEDGA